MKVVVIGASLSGITFALACANRGICTCVLERGHGRHQHGSALGVDSSLLMRVVGNRLPANREVQPFPVITGYRKAVSWQALHGWLRRAAVQCPEVRFLDGCSVSEVVQSGDFTTVITADGARINAQMVVGADGYQSVVRKAVDPTNPCATYSGYLLWRGLAPEADLPLGTRWPQNNDGVALVTKTGYRLVAYPVAGHDDSLIPGQRLISFAWYDRGRASLLRKQNCVSTTGCVLSSLSSANIPDAMRMELRDLSLQIWPEPWSTAIVDALDRQQMFATPVAEYFPKRLVNGRMVLIGDAAHVASPVTGQGLTAGILDAHLLAKCLSRSTVSDPAEIKQALESFERHRLPAAQSLVQASMAWSRAFVAGEEFASWRGWKRKLPNKS